MVAEAKPAKKARKKPAPPPESVIETVAFTPEAEAPAPARSVEVSYYIQLGSFSDSGNAAAARDRFAAVWPVQFIEVAGASGPVYRVRLGPISASADAEAALIDAQASGYGDARLIRNEAVQASLE
jgi:cell division protein FtsN